jgi:hypothetical protein
LILLQTELASSNSKAWHGDRCDRCDRCFMLRSKWALLKQEFRNCRLWQAEEGRREDIGRTSYELPRLRA